MTLTPRTIGPYRILRTIGRGGMGVVYRARHEESSQEVALKTVRVTQPSMLAGMRREIQALAALHHPGIVGIVAHGVAEGTPWYAMEIVEGISLRERIEAGSEATDQVTVEEVATMDVATRPVPRPGAEMELSPAAVPGAGPRVPLGMALHLVRRLCVPLAYMHGEGLVHRDLKPDNVLVRPDGSPVILDFGLTYRAWGESSREVLDATGDVAGTVAYMAPEQARGEMVDARADLYALGCIAFELLTGRPPFLGSSPAAVLWQHLWSAPDPPSWLVPEVPAAIDALVGRLLAKDPRERYGYAADLARAIDGCGLVEPLAEPPRGRPYLYRPGFAGRSRAREEMKRRVAALKGGRGGLGLLSGESGAGKTRHLAELVAEATRAGALVLTGEGVPLLRGAGATGGAPVLGPMRRPIEVLAEHLKVDGESACDRVVGARGPVLRDGFPVLRGLPGQERLPDAPQMPPAEARERLLGALQALLQEAAGGRAMAIVLDDLQWADEMTLAFLGRLAVAPEPLRFLVVGAFRSEEIGPGLEALRLAAGNTEARCDRLDAQAIRAMASDMLAVPDLAPSMEEVLVRLAEGNPLFLAEYLRAAITEELLGRDAAGRWQLAGADEGVGRLALPGSLRELLARRLHGLGVEEARLLDLAAVLGRDVDLEVLAVCAGAADLESLGALGELLRRQILEDPGEGRLRFTHDKLRETAYGSIEPQRRAAVHRASAEALAARQAEDAVLGHHWEQAGEPLRAKECYLRAATELTRRFALADAERMYRKGLALAAPADPAALEARRRLATVVLAPLGRAEEAAGELEDALSTCRAAGLSEDLEFELMAALARIHYERSRMEDSLRLFQECLTLAQRSGDPKALADANAGIANAMWALGRIEESTPLYERAVELRRELGDERLLAYAIGNLGIVYHVGGQLDRALVHLAEDVAILERIDDRAGLPIALRSIAATLLGLGRRDEAIAALERAVALCRETGRRRVLGVCLGTLGDAKMDAGDLRAARADLEQAVSILREVGDARSESNNATQLAAVCRRLGDLEAAEQAVMRAEELIRLVGDRATEISIWCARGHLEIARGRSCEDVLVRIEERLRELGAPPGSKHDRERAILAASLQAFERGEPLAGGELSGKGGEGC